MVWKPFQTGSSYRDPFWKITLPMPTPVLLKNLKNDLKIETLLSRKVLKFFCSAFFRASAELFLLSGMFKTSAYCMQHWLCSKENWTHTSIPLWLWVLWWCSSSRFVLSQYGPRTNFTHKHFLVEKLAPQHHIKSLALMKELLHSNPYFIREWISIKFINTDRYWASV